jgi:hypothetical protein
MGELHFAVSAGPLFNPCAIPNRVVVLLEPCLERANEKSISTADGSPTAASDAGRQEWTWYSRADKGAAGKQVHVVLTPEKQGKRG